MSKKDFCESDLAAPVKSLLQSMGCEVRCEVCSCDMVGVSQGRLVVCEMKKAFNLELALQLADRLRFADNVYAVVADKRKRLTQREQDIRRLLRRIGAGYITVDTRDKPYTCKVVLQPSQPPAKHTAYEQRLRQRVLDEFSRREEDYNTAGSVGVPLYTAYRLAALKAAEYINAMGAAKASDIAKATGVQKARAIMYRNALGWFTALGGGVYDITEAAREALRRYHEIAAPSFAQEWSTDDAEY